MTKHEFRDYFNDMLISIGDIETFTQGMSIETFRNDKKTVYAVTRCIEIIGEASLKIPNDLKDRYPAIPWKQISGMRNKMVHEYFGVDVNILWQTIREDIPSLRNAIQTVISEYEK